jgi:hypothetical protein
LFLFVESDCRVGVGEADFSNMNTLDADTEPLRTSDGKVAQRDIVQV